MRFSLVPALLLLLNISLSASALPDLPNQAGTKNTSAADASSAEMAVETLADTLLSACDNGTDDDEKSSHPSRTLFGVILFAQDVPYAVSAAFDSFGRYSSIRAPPSL